MPIPTAPRTETLLQLAVIPTSPDSIAFIVDPPECTRILCVFEKLNNSIIAKLRPELAGGQVRTGEVLVLVLGLAAPLSQSLSLLIGLEVMAELGREGENCLAEEVGGQI